MKTIIITFTLLSISIYLSLISFAANSNSIKVLFLRNKELFTVNSDGSSEQKYIYTRGSVEPRFSPDGNKIVYTKEYDDHYELWMLDIKNKNNERLTDGFYAVWLNDTFIYFYRPGKNPYHPDEAVDMKSGWVHFYKKNIVTGKEEEIKEDLSKGLGLVEFTSPVEYCSQKNNIMFISGQGRGAGCLAAYNLKGKRIQLPDNLYDGVTFCDYSEKNSLLIVKTCSEKCPLCLLDMKNKKKSAFLVPDIKAGEHSIKFAGNDAGILVIINQKSNLELLSDCEKKDTIEYRKRKVLTGSGDVFSIERVIDNKIFYVRQTGGSAKNEYYLWCINIDGSSAERITKIDRSVDFRVPLN